MQTKISMLWLVILLLGLAGCEKEKNGMEIVSVVYTVDSGVLLPEMQWHEEISITRNKALLTRNGKTGDSMVNIGSWEISLEEQQVTPFFEQLQRIDCSKIKRVEPKESPDGGRSLSYAINYKNGKSCTLYYDPGTTYTNGEAVAHPIDAFIKGILFPADAIQQVIP